MSVAECSTDSDKVNSNWLMLLENILLKNRGSTTMYPVALAVVLVALLGFIACRPQPTQNIERPVPAPPQLKQPATEVETIIEPPAPQPNEPVPLPAEPAIPTREEPPIYTADQPQLEPVQVPPSPPAEDKLPVKTSQGQEVQQDTAVSFHDNCADILREYVDENGNVDYKNLSRRKPQLKQLLDKFAGLDPNQYAKWPINDQMAFWINAYNIKLLDIIVANYPIQSSRMLRLIWPPNSIRHIRDIWTGYKVIVMDEEFTLSMIQDTIFYQQFDQPKIFFAISYASVSGPALRNEPYYGHKLRQQLDDQTRKFLSQKHAFSIDSQAKVVYLSAILRPTWHGREFIEKYGTDKKFKDKDPPTRAVLNFITNYVSAPDKDNYVSAPDKDFLETENYTVEYTRYDWRLNE